MRLLLLRHGETESNNQDLLQGQLDGQLSARGREQAAALAEVMGPELIDVIYCSDLRRAVDTAHIIGARRNIPIHQERVARERCFGRFEGTSRAAYYARERALPDPYTHRPDGGESFTDVYARVWRFLHRLVAEHAHHTVVVVAHGDFARMCIGVLTGKTVAEACQVRQKNACINILDVDAAVRGTALVLNQVSHLPSTLHSGNASEW